MPLCDYFIDVMTYKAERESISPKWSAVVGWAGKEIMYSCMALQPNGDAWWYMVSRG